MKVLVTGGRDWGLVTPRTPDKTWLQAQDDRDMTYAVLDSIREEHGIDCIVQGGQSGADDLAEEWAREREIPKIITYVAGWKKYGNSAGPIRNKFMLDDNPDLDLVIAFPGGKGTANMVKQAQERGIPVQIVN